MSITIVNVGSVSVEVQFKPIKNLHLSVHPPFGKVTVSSPDFYDLEKVAIYLATKLAWIKREQKKIASQDREAEKLYLTKESHQFFGKRYLLQIEEAKRSKIVLQHNKIVLYAVKDATVAQKQKTLYDFYRKELRLKIEALVSLHATKMQLPYPAFKIQKMKTKWGSCTTTTNRLLFNIELAKKPLECIEYIVVHELVHLLERKHNKNFVLLMDRFMPEWRVQKKILNELPL
ncbi:metal-dependent hydrolase [Flavobacterium faecale]|uniref:Metal-dependent hydrolase n=1 Tax=Flavobacterium faecale TaxID=1355330 RepID=A0A2S1LGJ4_9FLAO|nr:SprT family zinc-dependent metalloprotease [Flavobacterium faecale]AWG22902.1 metal-dependent hydrolase [Flavobacterium faecale]